MKSFWPTTLGTNIEEAVDAFETSRLMRIPEDFPALKELLITLYDAYIKVDQLDKACRILNHMDTLDKALADNISLETAITHADLPSIAPAAENTPAADSINEFLCTYASQAKSINKARFLNAVLPGAGYYYVGQKKTALTSFIINALFIAASYQLYDRGYIPAAIILTSLETGWYFGGINGAGLAANEYNRCIYEGLGREVLMQNRLFPVLMIQKGF